MNHTRNTLYLALLSALFLFVGILSLRLRPLNSPPIKPIPVPPRNLPIPSIRPPLLLSPPRPLPPRRALPAAKPAPANTPAAAPSHEHSRYFQARRYATNSSSEQYLMVWVNTDSGIYHKPGTRFYGKTKQGKYMSEADAIKAGYRPAGKNSPRSRRSFSSVRKFSTREIPMNDLAEGPRRIAFLVFSSLIPQDHFAAAHHLLVQPQPVFVAPRLCSCHRRAAQQAHAHRRLKNVR